MMTTLSQADVVYCWGVAHHTGDMWSALKNLTGLVAEEGTLVVAIYNDQQYISRLWSGNKRFYASLPRFLRPVFVSVIWSVLFAKRLIPTLAAGIVRLLSLRNPFIPTVNWFNESRGRGMNTWCDLVDWVGSWPFEVAKPDDIFRFYRDLGFTLQEMTTCVGGHGCNEFVFRRQELHRS